MSFTRFSWWFVLKTYIKVLVFLGILGAIGYAAYVPIAKTIAERNKPRWRTAKVKTGDITKMVNATGTVRPVKSLQVGSFVSGPILELNVEFNQEVEANEILAKIDPRLFAANVARDMATLETRKADITRVQALLQQAINDQKRADDLKKQNPDYIADSEMDQIKFSRLSLEAQLVIANASVDQALATLKNSEANLAYCEIRAPEAGIIIDRKVEPGQTLAAQFQTPEMFVIGVGMREKMHIFADVDESEIGLIREAAKTKQPVTFTVDAYRDELFHALIEEVRFSSTTTQNVVTYPVVVGSKNPDLKLLPGMTANLSFQVQKVESVIKIPKAALRFYPPDVNYVHPDDRYIIEGTDFDEDESDSDSDSGVKVNVGGSSNNSDDDDEQAKEDAPASERVAANLKAKKRHVWKLEGEFLRAVEVRVGISDNRYTQLLSGDLDSDTELVTGQKSAGEE